MAEVIVVLDIGKSNIKLSVVAISSAMTLTTYKRVNTVLQAGDYPHIDIDGIWQWYCDGLQQIAREYQVRYLACTTHGATAVCIGQGEVVLPVPDYEFTGCEESTTAYANVRPPYAETLSPALDAGLNVGRQLYWLSQTYPERFATVEAILMYPQYWCWRLSGCAVSEVTSLGCHTDLWNPLQNRYSSLVDKMVWQALFPPLAKAGAILGTVLPTLADQLGLPKDCQVVNGIHDSNASLMPYLQGSEMPFTVISSGTWVIMAGVGAPIHNLSEQDDMLANVNAYGNPVPCIRFMGGREWEYLHEAEDCDWQDLQQVLARKVYALPAFTSHGGPFRHQQGKMIGKVTELNARERTALASLYCALVTHYCLERLQSRGRIYLEGSFSQNTIYCLVLQVLRAEQELVVGLDQTGTTGGVLRLILALGDSVACRKVAPEGLNWLEQNRAALMRYYQLLTVNT